MQLKTSDLRFLIIVDVLSELAPDQTPTSSQLSSNWEENEANWGHDYLSPEQEDKPTLKYLGFRVSNQILGEILFRPSEKNDFGEYPIALITAERWAQKLSDEWELEYKPWDLIHCTDQVTSVIAEVYRIVSHPQKFNEYNQMHRNN